MKRNLRQKIEVGTLVREINNFLSNPEEVIGKITDESENISNSVENTSLTVYDKNCGKLLLRILSKLKTGSVRMPLCSYTIFV